MKKRFSFKVLTAALVVVIQTALMSSAMAATTTYTAVNEFSTTQDSNSTWQYEYNDGNDYKVLPFYFTDWNTWTLNKDNPTAGPYSNVYKHQDGQAMSLHPDRHGDTGTAIDVAVVWKAPSDGKATIAAANVKHNANNDPDTTKGTKVWIEYNGTKYEEVALGYSAAADLKAVTLNVKQGDKIRFVAANNNRGGNNETIWPISVSLETAAAAAPAQPAQDNAQPAAANPKTGDAGVTLYAALAAVSLAGAVLLLRKRRANDM